MSDDTTVVVPEIVPPATIQPSPAALESPLPADSATSTLGFAAPEMQVVSTPAERIAPSPDATVGGTPDPTVNKATDGTGTSHAAATLPQGLPLGLLKALQRQKPGKHAKGWVTSPFAAERRKKKRKAVKAARKVNRK